MAPQVGCPSLQVTKQVFLQLARYFYGTQGILMSAQVTRSLNSWPGFFYRGPGIPMAGRAGRPWPGIPVGYRGPDIPVVDHVGCPSLQFKTYSYSWTGIL